MALFSNVSMSASFNQDMPFPSLALRICIYIIKNSIIECGKRCQIYIFIGLNKRLVWVFWNKEERDNDNETGLKESRVL